MLDAILWTERHRPRTLEALGMSPENRALVRRALDDGEIPHLLLAGPAGVGKTTLAYIIREHLDCEAIVLNASKDRGIDVIRERVATFARAVMFSRWNLVIMDEADGLTREAQESLRNLMESHADRTRFILTANFPNRIADPIRSRCVEIGLAAMDLGERARVLFGILDAEGVAYEPEVAIGYAEAYADLRRMINAAQRSTMANDGTLGPARAGSGADGAAVVAAARGGNWPAVVDVARDPGVDHQALLGDVFWAIPDSWDRPGGAAKARFKVGAAVHESGYTPDPVVHFLGTVAGLMGGWD